ISSLSPGSLAEIGVEDDDQYACGHHEKGDVHRHGPAPLGKDFVIGDQRDSRAGAAFGEVDRRIPVTLADTDLHHAGALAEQEEWLAARYERVQMLPLPRGGGSVGGDDPETAVGYGQDMAAGEHAALRRLLDQPQGIVLH